MLGHLSHLASRAQLPEAEAAASFAGSEVCGFAPAADWVLADT